MRLNNYISHNERVIFELANVTNEIQELGAQFTLLEIDDIEKAIKKLKSVLGEYKTPKSDVFSVTI